MKKDFTLMHKEIVVRQHNELTAQFDCCKCSNRFKSADTAHCEAGVRHRALLKTYHITQYMLLKCQQ